METLNNSSSEETGHQTQAEEETHQRETNNVLILKSGLNRGQKETETKPVNEKTDAPGLNEDKLENKSVRDNTAKVMEGETVREQLTGNNLQIDDGEEVNSTADGTRDQGLMEEEKHGNQREERDTLKNLSTGKEKHTQKLKTKERELKKSEETISRLIGQKKDKDKQIKELRVKLEEVKKKLQSVNREEETEKEKDQDVKGPLDTKNDLETEMVELQKKMKKMETQREIIMKEISVTTEKKMKVTHEIEEIIKMRAFSSPSISLTSIDESSNGVVLQCKSEGWYPEPEVLWLDGEGNVLSAGPTETVRGPDDLYTVSSRVTVDKRHGNRFTCRVQQNNINQTRETHIDVTVDFFSDLPGSASSAPVIIGSILGIMCLLAGALVVWKWRKNKHKNKKQHKDEDAEKDGEKSCFISSDPKQEVLLEVETDRELPAQRTTMETVNNSSSEETGHQTQTEEETHQRETNNVLMVKSGLDRGQKETETKPVNEKTDAPGLNEDKLETKSVGDNTATVMEGETVREQLTGNNLQTDDGEEVNSTADGTRDQGLMEEDKHGNQREERDTLKNLSTGKEKLTKKLKTKERELKKFEEQISKYIKQKKDKDQQIKELRVKLEEVKKKLQSVNREDETEKEKDQDVKGPLDTKNDLETEMEELQKKMKKMETQREIIMKEITLVIEKKMKVTHEIEEIIKKTTEKEGSEKLQETSVSPTKRETELNKVKNTQDETDNETVQEQEGKHGTSQDEIRHQSSASNTENTDDPVQCLTPKLMQLNLTETK
ncbi:uncharacterized protein [Channa argus]|uniref:uncharacterized protein n=1 Tax=Channa argus TaxID=215402 RepID=UPI00352115CB